MVCAALDGLALYSVGCLTMPCAFVDVPELAFSFADEAGSGRYACAWEGLAGSRGGALRLDLGMDAIGWACSTSFYNESADVAVHRHLLTQLELGSRNLHHTPSFRTSSILLQRFRNTASIRFRKSIIC